MAGPGLGPGQINVFVRALSRHWLSQAQVALRKVISSLLEGTSGSLELAHPWTRAHGLAGAAVTSLSITLMGSPQEIRLPISLAPSNTYQTKHCFFSLLISVTGGGQR